MDLAKDETTLYWEQQFKILKNQFNEYQEYSRSLEQELQHELNQKDEQIEQLNRRITRIENEKSRLICHLQELSQSSQSRLGLLESRLDQSKQENDAASKQIQQLEQLNDRLEHSVRSYEAQLKDKQLTCDELLEKNALLELHVEEKTNEAHVEIQKLKDKLRDVKVSSDYSREKDIKRFIPFRNKFNQKMATIDNALRLASLAVYASSSCFDDDNNL